MRDASRQQIKFRNTLAEYQAFSMRVRGKSIERYWPIGNARGKEKCRANGVDGVSRRLKASGSHCLYRSIIESVLHHRTDRYLHTGILKSNER